MPHCAPEFSPHWGEPPFNAWKATGLGSLLVNPVIGQVFCVSCGTKVSCGITVRYHMVTARAQQNSAYLNLRGRNSLPKTRPGNSSMPMAICTIWGL
jgi:hypothetical protein